MRLIIKAAGVLFIFVLVLVFVLFYNVSIMQRGFLVQHFSETKARVLKSFASISEEFIKTKDIYQIEDLIRLLVLAHMPFITYAGYINEDGVCVNSTKYGYVNVSSEYKKRIRKNNHDTEEYYVSYNGEQIHEFVTPFFIGDNNVGTFVVGFSQTEINNKIDENLSLTVSKIRKIIVVVLVLSLVLSYFFVYYIFVKPINMLTKAAQQIIKGNFNVEIKINTRDEMGVLYETFNTMLSRIKELDHMKDNFVSSVSHELRSPLSAIDGYCDLLIDYVNNDYSKEQQLKGLKIIKQATIRLASFVNNILDLAKIKANKLELKKVKTNVVSLIDEIVTLYQPLATQQKKRIYSEIKEDIPRINIDFEKIKQVIINLVSNALKFTKENGNICIKVFPSSYGYGDDYIEIWVQDDGVGIPKQLVDLIFQKFYQVQEGKFKNYKGTGLGLTIVFEMVRIHKGYVWVSSDENKGATFKIALPK